MIIPHKIENTRILDFNGQMNYILIMDYKKIIPIEPGKRAGKPCIRGMRITVYDILEYLASDMTEKEILEDFPELTKKDIKACLVPKYWDRR